MATLLRLSSTKLAASMHFYHDILGFNEFWPGGGSPKTLSWVIMRVPDGQDYLEMMLYNTLPHTDKRGTKNHICLVVPDVEEAVATLKRGRRTRLTVRRLKSRRASTINARPTCSIPMELESK